MRADPAMSFTCRAFLLRSCRLVECQFPCGLCRRGRLGLFLRAASGQQQHWDADPARCWIHRDPLPGRKATARSSRYRISLACHLCHRTAAERSVVMRKMQLPFSLANRLQLAAPVEVVRLLRRFRTQVLHSSMGKCSFRRSGDPADSRRSDPRRWKDIDRHCWFCAF